MLYLGHFSFTHDAKDAKAKKGKKGVQEGIFTAVVEAGSPEEAAGKLERLIQKVRKEDDLFEGAIDVYLEALVEVAKVPKAGFISHCISGYPEDLTTYCAWLRGTKGKDCRVYTMVTGEEEGEEVVLDPFVPFSK